MGNLRGGKMSFFDDDPFDSIVREFFGQTSINRERGIRKSFIQGEGEDRVIDFIEDENLIYLVFEFPGFNEKDVSISVKGNWIEIHIKKAGNEKMQDYLYEKLTHGLSVKKRLPEFVTAKNFNYTMRNGILEISFNKLKYGGKDAKRKIR